MRREALCEFNQHAFYNRMRTRQKRVRPPSCPLLFQAVCATGKMIVDAELNRVGSD